MFLELYTSEIFKLSFLIFFSIFLSFFIIILAFFFGTDNPDFEKVSSYECGFDPYEDARNNFDIRFYLVAILFITFDLEAVYFFPWCASFSFLNFEGFYSMIDFVFELLIGYIYAWQVGALEWSDL